MAVKKKRRPLRYFYLNDKLHKSLHINRGTDVITTWCYPDHKRVAYTYSDVLRRKKAAFTTTQVCKMIMRHRVTLERAIIAGDVIQPQFIYGLDGEHKKFKYMWREEDVMAVHAFYSTVHRGRVRKDGLVTPQKLPTPRELRAMMRDDEILYVKQGDKMVPTWQAEDF